VSPYLRDRFPIMVQIVLFPKRLSFVPILMLFALPWCASRPLIVYHEDTGEVLGGCVFGAYEPDIGTTQFNEVAMPASCVACTWLLGIQVKNPQNWVDATRLWSMWPTLIL